MNDTSAIFRHQKKEKTVKTISSNLSAVVAEQAGRDITPLNLTVLTVLVVRSDFTCDGGLNYYTSN